MAKRNRPATDTTLDPRAAWPFPKSPDPKAAQVDTAADGGAAAPGGDAPADGGARIHVDQVSLYTDPARNTIERVALEELVESPFNPRTNYEPQALQALAETIRGVGVMQPLLARPTSVDAHLKFNREHRGFEGDHPRLEIVYGHRRFRAAHLAGETHVPVIVRELTDAQAGQLQAIENVQRQDLDALEEAEGYQHYINTHHVSKDQLAEEVGLSRTHVYARLKLLTLPEEIKDAVRRKEIAIDIGLAIARLQPKVQAKALASLGSQHHDLEDGGKRSVRSAKRFLREKFTLDLRQALFDTEDAALLEGADACTACPKRAGNAPEYHDITVDPEDDRYHRYDDAGNPSLCTDPECYDAKKKAHLAIEAGKLQAKGKTVIAGNKARAIVGATGEIKGGYIALKDVKALIAGKNKKKASKVDGWEPDKLPEVATVVVQDPRGGKTHEVVKLADLKAAGVKVKEQPARGGQPSWEADRRKREEQRLKLEPHAKLETRINLAVLGAVRGAAAGQALPTMLVQYVARQILGAVDWQNRRTLATLHGVKSFEQLEKDVGSMSPDRLTTLMLDCALVDGVEMNWQRLDDKPKALYEAAKHYDVNVEEIRKDVSEMPLDTASGDLPLGDAAGAGDESEEDLEA